MRAAKDQAVPPSAIVGLVAVACWSLWTLQIRPMLEQRKPLETLPMIPNSHWFWGHLLNWQIKKRFLERQKDLVDYADDKRRVTNWMGPLLPGVCLGHWRDAHKLLMASVTRIGLPIYSHHFAVFAGSHNLLFLNGKTWARHQKALKSALHAQYVQDTSKLQRIVIRAASTLVQKVQQRISNTASKSLQNQSIEELTRYIALDVFGFAGFSHDFECCNLLRLAEFQVMFQQMEFDGVNRMQNVLQTFWPPNLFYWIPTKRNKDYLQLRAKTRGFLADIVQRRRKEKSNTQGRSKHNDLLDKLMEVHDRDDNLHLNGKIDKDELLIDVLLSILLAGFETTSTCMTYAIYLISRNPRAEACCLQEIEQKLPKLENAKSNDDDTPHKRIELPYCRAVIQETLRIYPVATATSRTLEKPLQLDEDLTIPKGYQVGASLWNLHRDSQFFPKPLDFRPDRWVKWDATAAGWVERRVEEEDDTGETQEDDDFIPAGIPQALLPFSGGARSCPGQHFAMEEATLALAILIQNLRFTVDPSYKVDLEWKGIVQKPKDGVPALIETRGQHDEL